jgi:phosphoserine phosphatase
LSDTSAGGRLDHRRNRRRALGREGKVVRVEQWLAARGLDWADVHSTFYTDSINDLRAAGKSDVPVATNPDDRLRADGRGAWLAHTGPV